MGTRLSAAVCDEVLDRGRTWTAPALVINEWYLTASEPIRDPSGRVIGVLAVGLLQAPFVHRQRVIIGVLLAIVGTAAAASLVLIFFVTAAVLRPIGAIVAMSKRVIAGNLAARVGIRPPGEMGVLCQAVDGMADALAEREERLKRVTNRQLGRSEKLASVGRLAAGVAHEINNPLTGVLSFACMMQDKANMDDQDRQDLELIIHETTRAAGIVRGLLDFARERPVVKTPLDLNEVVRRTIRLLGNQKALQGIVIAENLADTPAHRRRRRPSDRTSDAQPGHQRLRGHARRRHPADHLRGRRRQGARQIHRHRLRHQSPNTSTRSSSRSSAPSRWAKAPAWG